MSWLFSRALVEEYSEATSLGGEQSAPSNGSHIQQAYCAPDKMTDFSRLSRFGMTFKPLTENRGEELLTLYLEDFRARTSAQQDAEPESRVNDQECGTTWLALLAKYDRATSMWKTAQCSLLEDLEQSLETWPRWGLMRDGECWEQQMWGRRTSETEFGLWPTPTAHNAIERGYPAEFNRNTPTLTAQVQMSRWSTPTSRDWKGSTITKNFPNGFNGGLANDVKRFPTPQASDNRDRGNLSSGTVQRRMEKGKQISLSQSVSESSGALNPTWVEWLMGWPLGWTDLKPLEMDKFQQWQQQHGDC
jgi:hypothetical protein